MGDFGVCHLWNLPHCNSCTLWIMECFWNCDLREKRQKAPMQLTIENKLPGSIFPVGSASMWGFKPRAPWLTTYLKRPYLELKEDQMSARRFPKHLKLWAMSSFNCMDGHGCLWISMRQSSSISGQQHSFRTFSGWNLGHTRALLHLLQGQLKIENCARNAMQSMKKATH